MTKYGVAAPLVFEEGDLLRVSCDFDNTEDTELRFPREMCVSFGFFFPAESDIVCLDGNWMEQK